MTECERCGESFKRKGPQRHCSVWCRFASKVEIRPDDTCWHWIGPKDTYGYGQIRIEGVLTLAHRWSYENFGRNHLIAGLVLDHICRNRACVNPNHLEQVTQRENMFRGEIPTLLTHQTGVCQRGHDLSVHGLTRKGGMYCGACRNAVAREKYAMYGRSGR